MDARRLAMEEEAIELAQSMRRRLQHVNDHMKDDASTLDALDSQIDSNSEFLAKQHEKIDERLANQVRVAPTRLRGRAIPVYGLQLLTVCYDRFAFSSSVCAKC